MRSQTKFVVLFGLWICVLPSPSESAVFVQDRGTWPENWPEELEPLRDSSRTIGIGTGIQENIYEIPVPDAETAAKVWSAVLKLSTPRSSLTLYRMGNPPPDGWSKFLSNAQPTIRIYAPTGSFTTREPTDPRKRTDYEQLVQEGRALRVGEPWPESIRGKNGELPRYVVAEQDSDGNLTWVPADPFEKPEIRGRGFYFRARIDIDLVIDGKIFDLNRLKFPEGTVVFDRRFESELNETP